MPGAELLAILRSCALAYIGEFVYSLVLCSLELEIFLLQQDNSFV